MDAQSDIWFGQKILGFCLIVGQIYVGLINTWMNYEKICVLFYAGIDMQNLAIYVLNLQKYT